jgi:site-specific recombinase XerD
VQALSETDPKSPARIAEAPAHWLRYTYASHAIANGVPLDILRENLGHEDLATTSLYIRAGRNRQYRETAGRHRAKP